MKTFFLTFLILIIFSAGIHAQSNWPMATEITPRENIQSQPSHIPPEKRATIHILTWEASSEMALKERQTLTLRASAETSLFPPPSFFMPKVPQNVILASAPISAQEKSRGILLKLTLIPLGAGLITIPAATLHSSETTRYEVPELNILIRE